MREQYRDAQKLLEESADLLEEHVYDIRADQLRQLSVEIARLSAYHTALEHIANGHPNAQRFAKQLLSIG